MSEKYTWLFGENLGKTMNNNSYYLWRHIVNRHYEEVNAFYIAEKNKANLSQYNRLTPQEKRCFVWRNSIRHIRLFDSADLLFVSLSFRDVQPDRIGPKSYKPYLTAPLVYLQHGTLAMKRLDYTSNYADNCLLRFVYYNPTIPERLQSINGFKPYQLFDGIYHPRYCELAKKWINRQPQEQKSILWFITWREYFGNNNETAMFIRKIKTVLKSRRFCDYIYHNNYDLTICLHRFFTNKQVKVIREAVGDLNVRIVYAQDEDVMELLVNHDLLITDYSSVGFDFTFLGKPVILFQPDLEEYLKRRKLYCSLEELRVCNVEKASKLIDIIVNESYGINPFFAIRIPDKNELSEIADGKYNERFFQYFYQLEKNSIAFLGYDFTGIGGTVFATRALMEGLMEAGYLVRAYTLKQMRKFTVPAGVALKPATRQYQKHLSDKLAQKLVFSHRNYSYLLADPAKNAMRPLAGTIMTRWMKHIHANTVVSTRESLHLFLSEATSALIRKRIYYFHTTATLIMSLFPGVLTELQNRGIESAVFVTEANRRKLSEIGFTNYRSYAVVGNCLDSTRCLKMEDIHGPDEADNLLPPASSDLQKSGSALIHCLYLTRISSERIKDLDRMLDFARYLQSSSNEDIVIDLFGSGDYTETLLKQIEDEELYDYIEYHGQTDNIKETMKNADLVIDFAEAQSFGMPYIEAVLNGKIVLCRHNEGSDEVLADIPEAFYFSNKELHDKIYRFRQTPADILRDNYKKISQRYSRSAVTARFIRENELNIT